MSSKLKIAVITTDGRSLSPKWGTKEPSLGTAAGALLAGFADLDEVEVHVVYCLREKMEQPAEFMPGLHFHQLVVPKWGWMSSLYLGCILAIRKCLAGIKPDLVHGQGTEKECAIAAVFSGYPNVLTIHGNMRVHASRGEHRGRLFYRIAALLEGIALRRTDGVVSISSYTDDLVRPLAARTWLLPNAAQGSYFNARPAPASPPVMLFVGGFDERKNPVGFIEACGDLIARQGWTLRLCGGGAPDSAYVRRLEQLAAEHPWIDLAGWRSRDELLVEMERASLLVLPTLEDNCPMVVLEAMAVGLPVIASRVGGVPDLIKDGETGMMFDPHDAISMRNVTERMITSTETRERIGRSARAEALVRFHPTVIARRHLGFYREVLGG